MIAISLVLGLLFLTGLGMWLLVHGAQQEELTSEELLMLLMVLSLQDE